MDEQKKSRISLDQKQAHILAWKQSNLSKADYCKQHDVKYINFLNWFNQAKGKKKAPSTFIPIEVKNTLPTSSTFATISFGNRFSIELHQCVGADFIKQILTSCK